MISTPRVAILGVTGFVGSGLPALFAEKGIATTGISRAGKGDVPHVDSWQTPTSLDLAHHQAVINLAGEPIDQRWNPQVRQRFHESRIGSTQQIVHAISQLPENARPRVLINASAVGIYGDREEEMLPEFALRGTGYLADLCAEWEDAAIAAEPLGLRVVRLRIGIVLGRNGSAFEKLRLVFKFGIGGRLGSGQQWMPWIHLTDLRAAIVHATLSEKLSGPVNAVSPTPERNEEFTRTLAASIRRPALFPVPRFALRLALGEFADVLLASQRAVPTALDEDGFKFRFPLLAKAWPDLLG
jgi:uncharacterized protein